MVVFPNCKINLGLHVVGKRDDGYHNLETLFYPVLIRDALEVITSTNFSFDTTGMQVGGTPENNLCVKAYDVLKEDFPTLPTVSVCLHKAIPMGAGLGGGSADGAFMLTLLNKKFNLGLSEQKLLNYALKLGSDCPFFIINKPCLAFGRGEILKPVVLDLSGYKIVIVNPGIHVSTKEAFSTLKPAEPKKSILEIIQQPIESWKGELKNDFEETVFMLHPAIKEVKKRLYDNGSVYASMSGSGSSVFGIFMQGANTDIPFPDSYNCFTVP